MERVGNAIHVGWQILVLIATVPCLGFACLATAMVLRDSKKSTASTGSSDDPGRAYEVLTEEVEAAEAACMPRDDLIIRAVNLIEGVEPEPLWGPRGGGDPYDL